jgi:Ser/Thr protein kinase RdoA (MazF antagonist)
MNQFFFNLTPDIVIKAAESANLTPTGHCLTLNSLENRVYDLKLEDESHIVLKFYRPGRWTKEQIQEEHNFLLDLQKDEIPVCAPLHFPNGETINEIEDIYFAHWPRTGGRAPDELPDQDLQILGRLLGRIHNMGAAKPVSSRIELNTENYAHKPLKHLLKNNMIPMQYERRYSNAVNKIASIYDEISKNVPIQRIHGDCHLGNLLHGNNGWFFLDFDDFLMGPAVQDFWMLMPARDTEGLRKRNVFLEAYREFREFNENWFKLIEPLRALRYIHYAGWIAKRWEDPAFPQAFPHFGTEKYWEQETLDLEDQIDYYNKFISNDPQKNQAEPQEELTNKDLFWDLD